MVQLNNYESKRIVTTILTIIAVAFLLLFPDYLYQYVNSDFVCSDKFKVFKLLIPLCIGLVTNKYKTLTFLCVGIMFLLQLIQFAHISYFGNQLSPYDFYQILSEPKDIILEAKNVYLKYWKTILIVLIPFMLIFLALRIKTEKFKSGPVVLLATLGWMYYSNCFIRNPTANEYRFTIDNSLKSFSCFINLALSNYDPPAYKSYIISKTTLPKEPIFIVYIIGESSNYNHMSLFGYERDTTPNLQKLAKKQNFYNTKGIAGGIVTKSSLKFMTSIIREPNNIDLSYGNATNLFKLAKNNNFKTFYISAQLEGLISIIGEKKYIDIISTASRDEMFDIYTDQHILTILNQQTFSDRNFIVLHQRCAHTPYRDVFSKDFQNQSAFSGSENPMIDEYDNAMLYNDSVISALFNHFNKQKSGKFYIIWASDHNELLGENGLFGHGLLVPECANVPVIVQSNGREFMDNFKKIYKPNHYEITKALANILGYEIRNPNEKDNEFYIGGVDFNGKCGYIKYKKDSETKTVTYFEESKN